MTENTRNRDTTETDIGKMFSERKPADTTGYTNQESGGNEGARGDDDAPWVKEPSFTSDAVEIVHNLVVTVFGAVGAQYQALPSIQCKQARLLQVYFAYTMAVGGRLSLIPEIGVNGVFYATTLVGSTVTAITPTGMRFGPGGFGSRALEGTELRTDAFVVAGTARFGLTFDVAAVELFRLNVLDLTANAGNTLQMFYALSS
jgi:hypothetical protein